MYVYSMPRINILTAREFKISKLFTHLCCLYLAEGNVEFWMFLRASHDEFSAAVVEGEITDEDPTLIEVLGAIHTVWEWRNG